MPTLPSNSLRGMAGAVRGMGELFWKSGAGAGWGSEGAEAEAGAGTEVGAGAGEESGAGAGTEVV